MPAINRTGHYPSLPVGSLQVLLEIGMSTQFCTAIGSFLPSSSHRCTYEPAAPWLCLENRQRKVTERPEPLTTPSWGSSCHSRGPNCHPSNGTRKDNEVPITGGTWPSVLPAGGKVGVWQGSGSAAPTLSACLVALGQALHGEVPGCVRGAEPHQDTLGA